MDGITSTERYLVWRHGSQSKR